MFQRELVKHIVFFLYSSPTVCTILLLRFTSGQSPLVVAITLKKYYYILVCIYTLFNCQTFFMHISRNYSRKQQRYFLNRATFSFVSKCVCSCISFVTSGEIKRRAHQCPKSIENLKSAELLSDRVLFGSRVTFRIAVIVSQERAFAGDSVSVSVNPHPESSTVYSRSASESHSRSPQVCPFRVFSHGGFFGFFFFLRRAIEDSVVAIKVISTGIDGASFF